MLSNLIALRNYLQNIYLKHTSGGDIVKTEVSHTNLGQINVILQNTLILKFYDMKHGLLSVGSILSDYTFLCDFDRN